MPNTNLLNCPKCGEVLSVLCESMVPDSQRLAMTLKSESTWMPAELISESISATAAVLIDIAKNLGETVSVFVEDIVFVKGETGEVRIQFVITKIAEAK